MLEDGELIEGDMPSAKGSVVGNAVLVERRGELLIVSINRPHVRNAVNHAVAESIANAMHLLDEDPTLRVGILTGTGGTFCAGMDLKAFVAGESSAAGGRGFGGLVEMPPTKPLVAAVEGFALAGGLELALCCDLIVASEEAVFGLPEVNRGLVAAGGGLIRLPSRIPHHHAMEFALLGNHFTACRASDLGLVNRLVPVGTALDAAIELALAIARNGPLAVAATKSILVSASSWSADEKFSRQEAIAAPVRASADAREGATAFAQSRPPVWSGR